MALFDCGVDGPSDGLHFFTKKSKQIYDISLWQKSSGDICKLANHGEKSVGIVDVPVNRLGKMQLSSPA